MEFLRSFLKRHFAWKPVLASVLKFSSIPRKSKPNEVDSPVFFCTQRQLPLVSSTNSLLRFFACITLNRVNALALLKKQGCNLTDHLRAANRVSWP